MTTAYTSRGHRYPESYHAACNHLVAFGAHRYTARGRALVARAIRDMRASMGHEAARHEVGHLRYISGCLPVKGA